MDPIVWVALIGCVLVILGIIRYSEEHLFPGMTQTRTPPIVMCGASDPQGRRCVLAEGHPGPHVPQQSTLVRVYRAPQQADAQAAFQSDAQALADRGYRPTAQSWAQGQWGCGAWLVALLLCVILVGLLVFLYMLIVKPEGTLTVTYTLEIPAPVASRPLGDMGSRTLTVRLAELEEARRAGVITDEEYQARRISILERA